ncbi:hypothetical protein [Cohnella herbarum]|uniref:Uncharacterized protein n=1 Tax=Cohnella herbarum TaxID=2728023 RepID=A0A7Z2VR36_9BACL|nr:hypothetical protein [Cohnella herbarum]QJD87595.1 hypothetical protein HH215_33385 [Cohnella herbarum]
MKQSIKDLFASVTLDGKPISFSQFLKDNAGNYELYQGYIGKMLEAASGPDFQWSEVDDYVGPIAHEVISEAYEADHEIYQDLVFAIQDAYDRLKDKHLKNRGFMNFEIKFTDPDAAEQLDILAMHLRDGWVIEKIKNESPNECHQFMLIRPEIDD